MSEKKNDKEEKLSAEEALNKRVDAMMNPELPDPDPVKPNSGTPPPLDIFKDAPASVAKTTKTAPEVSGNLLQKVDTRDEGNSQTAAPPPSVTPKKEASPHKPKPKQPAPQHTSAPPEQDRTTPLDDQETDRAIDDIASHEGDTILALQDAIVRKKGRQSNNRPTHVGRTVGWLVLLLLAVVAFLLIIPYNSYTCRWPVGIRLSVTTDILPSVCK